MVSFPRVLKSVACSVEGFPESAHNLGRLIEHFMYRHWKFKIVILLGVPTPLPQCNQCGMKILVARLWQNRQTVRFDRSTEMCLQ